MNFDSRLWCICTFVLALSLLTPAAMADHWPHWRGPENDGMAVSDAPLKFSDTENVKWKLAIPGKGNSSPVIWENKLFVTTAIQVGDAPEAGAAQEGRRRAGGALTEHNFDLLCIDKNTGKILWQKTAITTTPHEGYHERYGSFASNSPVTDGKHVFAFFGSRGIYAYDLDGNLQWKKDLNVKMRMRNAFGEGTAAVLEGDTLLLNFDQESNSFLVALNKSTGEELWRQNRDEVSAWAPPFVAEHEGRKQVIVAASAKVRSYDLETGKLIWECAGLGTNVIPAPVQQGDAVFVMSGHRDPNLMAIRLGREGDLTGTDAVLWSQTRGTSYTASPVLDDGRLYVLTDRGFISAFDTSTGEAFYHQVRLPNPYSFKASLVGAAGKLYLSSEEGDVIVLKMGPEYEALAVNTFENHSFIASPAIVDNEIFLRSETTLFCVSEK
jgi:outer membrane protein assembly factor BamB